MLIVKVVVLNDYRVEAVLSCEELDGYGISYEEIDYKNIETRRFLWSVTGDIASLCGVRVPLSGKILIEVIKDAGDEFRICFSSLGAPFCDEKSVKQLVKTQTVSLTAEFADIEYVLKSLPRLSSFEEGALVERDGKYRMLFDVLPSVREELVSAVCEFAEKLDYSRLEAAKSREGWNCIIPEKAVKKLREYF